MGDKASSSAASAYLRKRLSRPLSAKEDEKKIASTAAGGRPPAPSTPDGTRSATPSSAASASRAVPCRATGYDKWEIIYQGTVDLVSIRIWRRDPVQRSTGHALGGAEKGRQLTGRLRAWCSTIWDNCRRRVSQRMDREFRTRSRWSVTWSGEQHVRVPGRARAEVFPDADYADLFAPPGFGLPSLPATRMAAILALHMVHDYSDRGDRRGGPVRCAAGSGRGWRSMTWGSTRPRWCTGAGGSRSRSARTRSTTRSRRWPGRPGCRRGGGAGRWTPTILADAVATQDTVTQLVSAVRRVAREVPVRGGADRGSLHRP